MRRDSLVRLMVSALSHNLDNDILTLTRLAGILG